jgi:rhamnogalacturonyl hydrolase YesR
MRKILISIILMLFQVLSGNGQAKQTDANAPLHALQPNYPVFYGVPTKLQVKAIVDSVFAYLNAVTPAKMINKQTGEELNDIALLDTNAMVKQGDFRLTSYEWGVTYAAMQRVFETTGDQRYADYIKTRFDFLAKWVPAVKQKFSLDYIHKNNLLPQPIDPRALDDAGAICAAMIKSQRAGLNKNLRPLIDNYIQFIAKKQYRLKDGTLARMRPQANTLWLDDLFMGVPALAQMGKLTGDTAYYQDAVKQVKQFSTRFFNKEKGLYMHGWVESMETHPEFRWGRANGWALLAKVELLDVLPDQHPDKKMLVKLLKAHINGLASYQSGSGFWHQLLDREDAYLETSATAIYAYCIAHACNKGWIDPMVYAPMAILAWNAVATKVNAKGQVEGTCVGTGMAFDPAFYYHRPVNVYAAHGYGPTLFAGAEIYQLLTQFKFIMNDSALQLLQQ